MKARVSRSSCYCASPLLANDYIVRHFTFPNTHIHFVFADRLPPLLLFHRFVLNGALQRQVKLQFKDQTGNRLVVTRTMEVTQTVSMSFESVLSLCLATLSLSLLSMYAFGLSFLHPFGSGTVAVCHKRSLCAHSLYVYYDSLPLRLL